MNKFSRQIKIRKKETPTFLTIYGLIKTQAKQIIAYLYKRR